MSFEIPDHTDIVHRLDNGISLKAATSGCDFIIENEQQTGVAIDTEKAFGHEALKPYCLLDTLEAYDDSTSTPFESLKRKMTSIYPEDKIFKEITRNGIGNTISSHDIVYFHYALYVEYREYPIDISYLRRKKPVRVAVRKADILPGLVIALQTMKKGEMSNFIIDSSLAFKEKGCLPRIPGNATILARVEVCDVIHSNEMKTDDDDDDDDEDDDENKGVFTFDKALNLAKKCHNQANCFFKYSNTSAAINKYNKAVQILLDARLFNSQEDETVRGLFCKLYSNLAVCHSKHKNYKKVCIAVNDAFRDCRELAMKNVKLLYHSAYALRMLGNYQLAMKRLEMAAVLNPTDVKIINEMKQLNKEVVEYNKDQEKQIYIKMFETNKDENILNETIEKDECNSTQREDWEQNLITFIDSDESSFSAQCDSGEKTSIIDKLCSQLKLNCVIDSTSNTVTISKRNDN